MWVRKHTVQTYYENDDVLQRLYTNNTAWKRLIFLKPCVNSKTPFSWDYNDIDQWVLMMSSCPRLDTADRCPSQRHSLENTSLQITHTAAVWLNFQVSGFDKLFISNTVTLCTMNYENAQFFQLLRDWGFLGLSIFYTTSDERAFISACFYRMGENKGIFEAFCSGIF